MIGIGVTIGPDAQVGALSLVPKHVTLDGGHVYVLARASSTTSSWVSGLRGCWLRHIGLRTR